jgi:hypothetical protein
MRETYGRSTIENEIVTSARREREHTCITEEVMET